MAQLHIVFLPSTAPAWLAVVFMTERVSARFHQTRNPLRDHQRPDNGSGMIAAIDVFSTGFYMPFFATDRDFHRLTQLMFKLDHCCHL